MLLPLVPTGDATAEGRARAIGWLERLGLGALVDTTSAKLSGGERQRGALARALITQPKLILLDEPTAHVDRESADEIVRVLGELRDEGATVLASTHDPRLVERAEVDRVVEMRDGKLALDAAHGSPHVSDP